MGRKKKKNEKKYDFGDFSLRFDIYKKKVVHFHLATQLKRDTNKDKNIVPFKEWIDLFFKQNFRNLKRPIFDLDLKDVLHGYLSNLRMNVYSLVFDDCEEKILSTIQEMLPQIRKMAEKYDCECVKPVYLRKYVERNTEL